VVNASAELALMVMAVVVQNDLKETGTMAGLRSGTVLCVDDEVEALDLRKQVLEVHGYRVLTASNAEEALTVFASEEIDVVLSDHLLTGQTYTALAAEMKRSKPDVAVAIYSAVAQPPEDIDKADVFIRKLVTPEELLAYLEAAIAAKTKGGTRANIAKSAG
jgi:two-component system response regulator CpxR